jgi:hypothetical protein
MFSSSNVLNYSFTLSTIAAGEVAVLLLVQHLCQVA